MVDSSDMETLSCAEGTYGKDETRRGKKGGCDGGLFSLPEDILQIHAGPADRTCVYWKSDRAALHAPTQPVEKLFFLAFDNHRVTSNTESGRNRVMRIQLISEPIGPARDAGNPMDVSDGSPNKSVIGACQQSSSRAGR